jgi:hypothetical protein
VLSVPNGRCASSSVKRDAVSRGNFRSAGVPGQLDRQRRPEMFPFSPSRGTVMGLLKGAGTFGAGATAMIAAAGLRSINAGTSRVSGQNSPVLPDSRRAAGAPIGAPKECFGGGFRGSILGHGSGAYGAALDARGQLPTPLRSAAAPPCKKCRNIRRIGFDRAFAASYIPRPRRPRGEYLAGGDASLAN